MKKMILALMLGILFTGTNLYAAGGDLIVDGKLGVGTVDPVKELDVVGDIGVTNRIYTGDGNFDGLYLKGGAAGGFVKKGAYDAPLIYHPYVFLGDDSFSASIAWDTIWDGQWGYCEGVRDNNAPSILINCADYDDLMDNNDHFFIWRHGYQANCQSQYGCENTMRDYQFLYDGQSNDGIMGYMEDEDAFFFDEKVGIGTRTPGAKLHVDGGDIAVTSLTEATGLVLTDLNGYCWRITVNTDGSLSTTSVQCP